MHMSVFVFITECLVNCPELRSNILSFTSVPLEEQFTDQKHGPRLGALVPVPSQASSRLTAQNLPFNNIPEGAVSGEI